MVRAFAIIDRVLTLALLVPTVFFMLYGVVGYIFTSGFTDLVDFGEMFIVFLSAVAGLSLRLFATLNVDKRPWFAMSAILFTAPAVGFVIAVISAVGFQSGWSQITAVDIFANVLAFAYIVTMVGALVSLLVHGWIWLFRPQTRARA